MTGWLVAKPYEVGRSGTALEVLYAVWTEDEEAALQTVESHGPVGAKIRGRTVAKLTDSSLRGLRLEPGQVGVLSAGPPPP